MPPLPFLALRFGVAAFVMLLVYWRRFPAPAKLMRDGIVLGLMNASGLLLQVFGQAYTTASKSAFITSLNTPLTPLVGLFLYRTRPTRAQRWAIVIATVGLTLLTWPGSGARWNVGDLLTLGCAGLYALTIVQIARRSPGHDVFALTAVQIAAAAVLFGGLYLASRVVTHTVPLGELPALLQLEARP